MAPLHSAEPKNQAMLLLDYAHAPVVGFYFLAALTFASCTLQKPSWVPVKGRRIAVTLIFAILTSYIAEVLFYLSYAFANKGYQAPQHAVINCLGSILVWSPLGVALVRSASVHWYPYLGAFILELLFETTLLVLSAQASHWNARYDDVPLTITSIRAALCLTLVMDAFVLRFWKRKEKSTDEEVQSLLGTGSNHSNGEEAYGSTDTGLNVSVDEDAVGSHDKDIKEQQAKRLRDAGGWVGYLQGFAVFLPHLWPKDDWLVMSCLFVRFLHLLQGRVFNLLTPRQLGIITNKLASGTHEMPWKDIGLWAFFYWSNSFCGFGILDNFADIVIRNKSSQRITMMAYEHVMNLSMDFHTHKESGEVLKAVEQASSLNTMVELVLFEICPIFFDLIIAIWYIAHLFDAYMAFIILFMGAIYVWLGLYFTSWAQDRRRMYSETRRAESQVVNETISNWQTVFYFGRAAFESNRYKAAIQKSIRQHYAYYFKTVGGTALQDLIITFGFMSCCIFAMSQIISGSKPLGNLVTLIMYWDTMMMPLHMISYSYRTITSSLVDAERLLQLLNTKPSVTDAKDAQTLIVKSGKVEFKGVDFAYDKRKQILKDVSLTAEGGQTIALVGETGGGKSTILKLLSRSYDVTGGSITIDGQDLRSITRASLIDALGYVPQDPFLFNRSIRDNIRYGRLDATDAEIEDACRAAAVHDAIVDFPDGYEAKVGERGVQLSGGQLQRIAIARVLLRNPKIVLLDEATSAVDSMIESQIQEAFRKLSAGRTTFVIAHRLSTIVEANQIIVIEKGEIIEIGTHAELLDRGGKYSDLWSHQIAGLSTAGSKVNSKANSTYGTDGTEILIDVTPPQIDGLANATGRSDEADDNQERSTRQR